MLECGRRSFGACRCSLGMHGVRLWTAWVSGRIVFATQIKRTWGFQQWSSATSRNSSAGRAGCLRGDRRLQNRQNASSIPPFPRNLTPSLSSLFSIQSFLPRQLFLVPLYSHSPSLLSISMSPFFLCHPLSLSPVLPGTCTRAISLV